MRRGERWGRLGEGDRLGGERQNMVQIGVPMQPGALDREGLVRDSWCQRRGDRTRCSPARERDQVRDTRELSSPGFTDAAGVGVLRRHKAGFEADFQGSRKQDMCDAFDRSNAIYPVHTSLEKTTV